MSILQTFSDAYVSEKFAICILIIYIIMQWLMFREQPTLYGTHMIAKCTPGMFLASLFPFEGVFFLSTSSRFQILSSLQSDNTMAKKDKILSVVWITCHVTVLCHSRTLVLDKWRKKSHSALMVF